MFERSNSLGGKAFFVATNLIPCLYPESQGEKAPVLGEFDRSHVPAIIALGLCVFTSNEQAEAKQRTWTPALTKKKGMSFQNGY
jgi:hypothetical protein